MTEHPNKNGSQGEYFTDNRSPRACYNIIYKPCRRADKSTLSDVGGTFKPKTDIECQHADNGQDLYYQIEYCWFFSKYSKIQNVY